MHLKQRNCSPDWVYERVGQRAVLSRTTKVTLIHGLTKRFMLLEVTTRGGGTMFYDNVLSDAYEQREYAEYQGDPFKSLPIGCQLMPFSAGGRRLVLLGMSMNAFVADI